MVRSDDGILHLDKRAASFITETPAITSTLPQTKIKHSESFQIETLTPLVTKAPQASDVGRILDGTPTLKSFVDRTKEEKPLALRQATGPRYERRTGAAAGEDLVGSLAEETQTSANSLAEMAASLSPDDPSKPA
ncbi:unnamed protein product [Sympodiomycopsis kandeliae]